jgi:hypothetical protein
MAEARTPSQILNYLYIGNRHHAKDLAVLKELGVKYVLNVTPPKRRALHSLPRASECVHVCDI